jgi:hypothetical protein
MQGRDHGDVPDEVSFINTQLSGRYGYELRENIEEARPMLNVYNL